MNKSAIYAAIGYSKLNKDIPIVYVISGCVLINTITGILYLTDKNIKS